MTDDTEEAVIQGARTAIHLSHRIRRARAAREPKPDNSWEAALNRLPPRRQRTIRAILSFEQCSLREYQNAEPANP